jgi:hypothetical protein
LQGKITQVSRHEFVGLALLGNSVANWQKFWAQNTKVAQKKSQQPDKSAAEFSKNLAKNGRTEAELFLTFVLNTKG